MLVVVLMLRTISSLRERAKRGVTLIECMAAMAVASLGLGALMSVNSYQLRVVHATHDANIASLCIEERMEQMRIATWKQITDPLYLRSSFYAAGPKAGGALNNVFEKIIVNAYPDATIANPIVVEREDGSAPTIKGPGPDMAAQQSVRVDLYLSYDGVGGLRQNRQTSFILSNGGVNRLTLPAFGSAASGTSTDLASASNSGSGSSGSGGSSGPSGFSGSSGSGSQSGSGTSTCIANTRGNVGGLIGIK